MPCSLRPWLITLIIIVNRIHTMNRLINIVNLSRWEKSCARGSHMSAGRSKVILCRFAARKLLLTLFYSSAPCSPQFMSLARHIKAGRFAHVRTCKHDQSMANFSSCQVGPHSGSDRKGVLSDGRHFGTWIRDVQSPSGEKCTRLLDLPQ